jgi:peptidyl-prolyl cis-trans isomerase B (cyclophilin B)
MHRRNLLRAIALSLIGPVAVSAGAQDPKVNKSNGKPASKCPTPQKGSAVMVKLHTSLGAITLELNKEKAPLTVANFLKYVESGFYSNTVFHRVIDNFMIQGGGFEPGMKQKPTDAEIQNEAANGLTNDAYTVAMARTPNPHSASSQFFINVRDNAFLNYTASTPQGFGYCVFAKVVEGKDVVDKIKAVKTGSKGGHQDVPLEDVTIERAEVC